MNIQKKDKGPSIPPERFSTVRKEILSELDSEPLSARDISSNLGIAERDVYEHLEHIQKSSAKGDYRLVVLPAECLKCGFSFRKRAKLKKPGKCPVCRGEHIQSPLFSIVRSRMP
jgi:predicted Zn-ribbon and HTH transcriptional regulator